MAPGSHFARLSAVGLLMLTTVFASGAAGQGRPGPAMAIDPSKLTPEQRAMMENAMRARGMTPPGAQSAAEVKPGGEAPKPEDGDKPKEGDTGVATIKRPTGDAAKADAEELKARPDKDGMVQFSFRGQAWADVLQWYADVAACSLDWQELPADTLNLTTQRRYTIPETRDLLNRHLLARGFTMLSQGEVLTVVKIDKIDPSLVPRVEPDDLEDHLPHDFARVRFELPEEMDPAKAVDDVKVLLNPAAKVTPLLASKQLMIIDAVSNLRDVRDLLYSEQLAASSDVRPAQFPIRYRRADYIADQIMIVLGLDPSSRKTPMELQLEQQRMQLLMQMQQQGKDVMGMLKQDGPQVFIAVDRRRNTVSVNAPPKEMAIVKRVVQQFDVPEHGDVADVADGDGGDGFSFGGEELTTEKYQTINITPDAIVTALKEIGSLNPLTQFTTDSSSKTIFATATRADHATIQRMLDKLDGSGRRLKVVWLSRRTPADQVAGTISALMVGEKKEDNNNRRPWYYYDYYGSNQQETPDTGFRIQADVENNRLLLWANDAEFAEVTALLEELGAIASGNGANPNTWRVLDARTPQETAELLKQLREAWGGRNPLNINVAPPASETPATETPAADPTRDDAAEEGDTLTRGEAPASVGRTSAWLAQYVEGEPAIDETTAAEPAAEPEADEPAVDEPALETSEAEPQPPPINITVTPDGRIVISSADVAALDQLQDLLGDLEPQQKQFEIFQLVNSLASSVVFNLEEYFSEELAEDEDPFESYFFYGRGNNEESPTTLGKRRKLRFIWDPDTNTILVQNASPGQLQVIRELIRIYDQPVGEDAVAKRKTDVIELKYSRATDIATALKEVYRDLLSSKDKEFQNERGDNNRGGGQRNIYYRFSSGDDNKKSAPVKMAFEGALSIGVDTVSNTLIISAEENIFENVVQIVRMLDEQAKPDTVVQVHEIRGSLSAGELQQALSTVLSRPWPGGKPEAAVSQQNGQNGGGGEGDRGGRRRGRDRGRD